MSKDLSKVLCPKCTYPGGLSLHLELVATPIGTFSLAGAVMKFSANEVPVLSCSLSDCHLVLVGRIEDGYAVFPDPHVQAVKPGD